MDWTKNLRAELVAGAVRQKADRAGGKSWALLLLPGRGLVLHGSTASSVQKYLSRHPNCMIGVYGRGCQITDVAEDIKAARGY